MVSALPHSTPTLNTPTGSISHVENPQQVDLLSSAKSGGDKPLEEPTGSMSGGGLGVAPHRHIKVVLDGGVGLRVP